MDSSAKKIIVKSSSGDKKGEIYKRDKEGGWSLQFSVKKGSFKALSRELRKKANIPPNVVINKSGETYF